MSRIVPGTRPRSILMSKVSSAAATPALPAVISNSGSAILAERRATQRLPSPLLNGIRLNIRDAIEHPGRIVGCGEQGRIADRGPQQPPKPVRKAGDRVPGRVGRRIDPQHQPAVPRKVLELHRANEHRRIEALDRIKTDVLDPVGEFGTEVLALDSVASDALAAPAYQRAD